MSFTEEPKSTPVERVVQPVRDFANEAASGGIVLLACATVAMALVNSPLSAEYLAIWDEKLTVTLGGAGVAKSVHFWINDGLMAVFFFVVGLEIKREVLVGELSSPRQAILPSVAAVGGMAVPAVLYYAFNTSGLEAAGWGIPMATDIAFALGVLALFGKHVPDSLKIFLTALAIFDDIGAVLVIAFFYTDHLTLIALAASGALLGTTAAANWLGVRSMLVYAVLGVALWIAMLNSGFHATVAGILLALAIPARARINSDSFVARSQSLVNEFKSVSHPDVDALCNDRQQRVLLALDRETERAGTPLQRLEHALNPWVALFVMPMFALANAGVALDGVTAQTVTHPVTLGIVAGLVLGKPLGIMGCVWVAVKFGLADLPENVNWKHIGAAGCLGGIGFTMALFIGGLAFDGGVLLEAAKIGILTGSLLAGVFGAGLLWVAQNGEEATPQS